MRLSNLLPLLKFSLMKPIDRKTIVKRNPELVSSNLDGEIVMMSVESGEYFGLDSVGSRIWELIENPVEVDGVIGALLEEFEVSREQCEADTVEFLNQLFDKMLLVVVSFK